MKNLKESGDRFEIDLVADTAPGEVVIAGELAGIAVNGGKAGDRDVCVRRGVFELPKATGALSIGDKAYWKADEKVVTKTATGNTLIGSVFAAAEAADALALVVLKG